MRARNAQIEPLSIWDKKNIPSPGPNPFLLMFMSTLINGTTAMATIVLFISLFLKRLIMAAKIVTNGRYIMTTNTT
jgi:hypothetical protein